MAISYKTTISDAFALKTPLNLKTYCDEATHVHYSRIYLGMFKRDVEEGDGKQFASDVLERIFNQSRSFDQVMTTSTQRFNDPNFSSNTATVLTTTEGRYSVVSGRSTPTAVEDGFYVSKMILKFVFEDGVMKEIRITETNKPNEPPV